jgi:Short C-terminal domain
MAAKFAGMRLNSDNLEYNRGREMLTGVSAVVQRAAEVVLLSRELQLTSSAPLAEVFGKQRRPDDLVLTILGPGFQWVMSLDSNKEQSAREFAAKVNEAARRFGPAYLPPPAASEPAATPDLVAGIAGLAQLHASGALSDEEFSAAKARLLR